MTTRKTEPRSNVHLITHPVIRHKLSIMRDKSTSAHSFRGLLKEISQYLAYETTRDLQLKNIPVETPLETATGEAAAEEVILVSVLRAGEGMVSGMLDVLPFATVGHIGIYRDRFIKSTVEYYLRMPTQTKGRKVIVLDPMLASGDTAVAAINRIKEFEPASIRLATLLCSEVGISRVLESHPDVEIYTTSIERGLNERGYLLPGLGDAGDRLFDTIEAH